MNKTIANCSGAFINKPQTGKNAKARRNSSDAISFLL